MKKAIILFHLLLAMYSMNAQQIKTVDLYPAGQIPYQIQNTVGDVFEYDNQLLMRKKTIQVPGIEIYYPENAGSGPRATVLICPGGGYTFLSHYKEGVQVAQLLNSVGIIGVVMNSRLPDDRVMTNKAKVPLADVHAAMKHLRENAATLGIISDKIAVMGFSAGGHLAATAAVHYQEEALRPDLSILIYPVITMDSTFTHKGSRRSLLGTSPSPELVAHYSAEKHITAKTPPTFILHTTDDATVPVQNSMVYMDALIKNRIKNCSFHIFPTGGHGYDLALNKKDSLKNWPDLLLSWLKDRGW